MTIISRDKNVIKLFFTSDSSVGKQTLGYLQSTNKNLLAIDISKTKVTGTQWVELCDKLNCSISDLINKEHPNFTDNYESSAQLSDEDWIKVLNQHPGVFVYPIVILGDEYYRIENPSDIEKHLEGDSEGLDEKHPDK